MDGEAGWWSTSGNIGLPPLARAMGVGRQQQHLQYDLNSIYNWAVHNNMFFNSEMFHYISFSSSLSFNSYNVYANPIMEIINPSENVLDLGIFMSSNCSFEFHIQNLCKKCSNLSGWILRTFTTRDSITMLTLFKSLNCAP